MADIDVVPGEATHTARNKKVMKSCMRRIAYNKVKALLKVCDILTECVWVCGWGGSGRSRKTHAQLRSRLQCRSESCSLLGEGVKGE